MESLKLAIELIPLTSWQDNLRKAISPSAWDRLRKSIYAKFNYHCGICNATGHLRCHRNLGV